MWTQPAGAVYPDSDDPAEGGWAEDSRDVPTADPDAVVDPFWLDLRGPALLPNAYMPPFVPGRRPPWLRAVAALLAGVFVFATALGFCLTYGIPLR
jgi:hypothetical protein